MDKLLLEVDECPATGATHYYQKDIIPSEFVSGQEDGEALVVIQCVYCGHQLGG
ncbi:hypothetical protein FDJ56_gp20 [Pectobacterium phage vB_PatP_CB5]|uniref:Uncharacterized protein n=1 Tax=Pectobacterium phage vB_PatP_CB5 TaxID=1983582 RepID=A0A2U7N2K0_9CAUD|nr:hypothetical protein FDJ56_gp20 [Pectobacterium phage vB_PatP_CB5]ARW58993.1 hypothetical protein CB5_21 [Pectobacterium phage vB_PatP_CB5]